MEKAPTCYCETFADGSFAALLGGKPRGLRGHRGDPGAEDQHGLLHHRGGLRQCEELQQREVGSSRVRSHEVTASSLCNVVPGPEARWRVSSGRPRRNVSQTPTYSMLPCYKLTIDVCILSYPTK